jgi:hypothetical protein
MSLSPDLDPPQGNLGGGGVEVERESKREREKKERERGLVI